MSEDMDNKEIDAIRACKEILKPLTKGEAVRAVAFLASCVAHGSVAAQILYDIGYQLGLKEDREERRLKYEKRVDEKLAASHPDPERNQP